MPGFVDYWFLIWVYWEYSACLTMKTKYPISRTLLFKILIIVQIYFIKVEERYIWVSNLESISILKYFYLSL